MAKSIVVKLNTTVIVPLDARRTVKITEADFESYIDFIEDHPEHRPRPETVGQDLRRLFGDDGYDLYAHLVALSGRILTTDEREQKVAQDWRSFDRERLPSDALLIDALDDARAFGWSPSAALSVELDRLSDIRYAVIQQERDAATAELEAFRIERETTLRPEYDRLARCGTATTFAEFNAFKCRQECEAEYPPSDRAFRDFEWKAVAHVEAVAKVQRVMALGNAALLNDAIKRAQKPNSKPRKQSKSCAWSKSGKAK